MGGGVHGLFAAYDAAQRGLSVALVEARDFGGGASWNSLKTIHGGLRHLQRLEPGLTRGSMRERRALLSIAPEIVRPLPFLIPTYGHGLLGREAFALGLLCAGITIMAYWRHSATYVAEGSDLGLLDAVPQRLGEWLFPRAGWLALASFCAFKTGLVLGLVSFVPFPAPAGTP